MDDSYGLFRPEAVAEYKNRLGAPIDANNIATWAFSLFFTSILVVALVLLCTTRYARKENVLGQVTPVAGALRIAAARNGLVSNVLVKEGQHVSAGQEVIALSFAPKLGSGNLLSSSLELNESRQQDAQKRQAIAKTSQINHQIAELIARRNGVQADLIHIEHEKKLQEERVKIQEDIVAATHSLGSQGMMPLLTVKAKDDDLIVARQSLASIERNYVDQRNTLDQIGAQLGRLDAELEIVKSDYATQQEQMEEKRLNAEAAYSDHLVAPVNGYVTALQVKAGGPVLANQTLAVVVPDSKDTVANVLEVELWAPSKAIGFIRTGGRVRLMYDAFPYQTFGVGYGSVTEITRAPIMPSEVPIPIDAKEQLFRIRVALDNTELSAYGRRWPLSPGMRVSADLVLEERSLLRWLLDPLLAIRKRSG